MNVQCGGKALHRKARTMHPDILAATRGRRGSGIPYRRPELRFSYHRRISAQALRMSPDGASIPEANYRQGHISVTCPSAKHSGEVAGVSGTNGRFRSVFRMQEL